MLGLVSNYDSTKHTIIGGDISEWVNRLVKGDPQREGRFVIIRYNELGVFVIAEWLGRPKDVFVEDRKSVV